MKGSGQFEKVRKQEVRKVKHKRIDSIYTVLEKMEHLFARRQRSLQIPALRLGCMQLTNFKLQERHLTLWMWRLQFHRRLYIRLQSTENSITTPAQTEMRLMLSED